MRPNTRESIVQIFKRAPRARARGEEPRESDKSRRRRLVRRRSTASPGDRYFLGSPVAKNTPDCLYNFFRPVVVFLPRALSSRSLAGFPKHANLCTASGEKNPRRRCRFIVETGKPRRSVFGGMRAGFSLSPLRNVEEDVGWLGEKSRCRASRSRRNK